MLQKKPWVQTLLDGQFHVILAIQANTCKLVRMTYCNTYNQESGGSEAGIYSVMH